MMTAETISQEDRGGSISCKLVEVWSSDQQERVECCLLFENDEVNGNDTNDVASEVDNYMEPNTEASVKEHFEVPGKHYRRRRPLEALRGHWRFFKMNKWKQGRKEAKTKENFDDGISIGSHSTAPTSCTSSNSSSSLACLELEQEHLDAAFQSELFAFDGIDFDDKGDDQIGLEVTMSGDRRTECTIEPPSQVLLEEIEDPPLIQSRLFKTGIVKSTSEFEFVVDRVSKEVIGLPGHELEDEEKEGDKENNGGKRNVTHVKTGIWEVTCFDDVDGAPQTPFYIVTGVSMDDRVDTKKLRKAVFAGAPTSKRRPKLCMAPTDIAEKLAGFKSGTMTPICHSVDMKLYLEESIAKNPIPDHRLCVGSGMFGKCLSLPAKTLIQIAENNAEGLKICSLIRQSNKSDIVLREQTKKHSS